MLPLKGLEFNISELARGTGVTRQTLVHVVKKLVKWNALKITTKHGNANYYALNEGSGYVEAFERLNNCIIEQMLGEEALNQIADYWIEHAPIARPKPIRINAKSLRIDNPFGIKEGWTLFPNNGMNMKNRGIISMGNSQIRAGSIAVGSNARIENVGKPEIRKDYEEIIRKLDEYAELIRANRKSLENVDEMLVSISIIGAEFKRESPNRTVIKGVLNDLASSVSSISSLATAVAALKTGILAIL